MSSSDPKDDAALERAEDQFENSGRSGGKPPSSRSPADRMRDELAARQSGVSDDDEAEEELWSGGYSSKAMFGTWVLLAIVSVGLLILAVMVEWLGLLVALGVVLLIWIIGGLVYAYRSLSVHYQLTNQRFVHQNGLLSRRTDRIEVIDIDDVTCTQGPIERLFGVGTVILTGSDRTHPTLSMIGIAGVRDVAALIDDTRRKERRRRSLHIEAV